MGKEVKARAYYVNENNKYKYLKYHQSLNIIISTVLVSIRPCLWEDALNLQVMFLIESFFELQLEFLQEKTRESGLIQKTTFR